MSDLKSDDEYREFILGHLPRVTTLFRKVNISDEEILQETFECEDVADLVEVLSATLNVNCENFHMENYFPWKPDSLFSKKSDNAGKVPLTLKMFIDSAKAGRWLYG